jgi:hypothetical protein
MMATASSRNIRVVSGAASPAELSKRGEFLSCCRITARKESQKCQFASCRVGKLLFLYHRSPENDFFSPPARKDQCTSSRMSELFDWII